jgi:hypothetical protein
LLVPNVSDEQMKAKPKQGAANCGSDWPPFLEEVNEHDSCARLFYEVSEVREWKFGSAFLALSNRAWSQVFEGGAPKLFSEDRAETWKDVKTAQKRSKKVKITKNKTVIERHYRVILLHWHYKHKLKKVPLETNFQYLYNFLWFPKV